MVHFISLNLIVCLFSFAHSLKQMLTNFFDWLDLGLLDDSNNNTQDDSHLRL